MQTTSDYIDKKNQKLAKSMLESIISNKSTSKKIALNILGESSQFVLPPEASSIIIDLLKDIASGGSRPKKLLSTQEASDILGVSRPHLVKLLEAHEIPFVKVGTHRRLSMVDVNLYKQKMIAKRNKRMQFLQKQAQELNLGYE